jgi:DNA-binding protein H-NS
MRRKKIFPITPDGLQTYSTKRLLARLKSLHQCEESFELSDREEFERDSESRIIEFKETPEWQGEYQKLKEILRNRVHIERNK